MASTETNATKPNTQTGTKTGKTLRLKWFKSSIACPTKHKLVIKGLGFTRLSQVIEREDTPSIRGMVAKVPHLVSIEP
ncbi:MAG: 50S ribosomal protein L30 [Acidobacteriaceae bacterium]